MRRLGCLFVLALVSACSMTPPGSSPGPAQSSPSPGQSRFATTEPLPGTPAGTPVELPVQRLAAVTSDLRGRGVTGEVTVISAENVRFNDGSLGCPQPGVQYTQAQIDGMRVIVEAAGRRYDYRFGNGEVPLLCEQRLPGAVRSSTR
jgi:hypothetical protein